MKKLLPTIICPLIVGCAILDIEPTGYQKGAYTTEAPYRYGYWESCAYRLTYDDECNVVYLASRQTEEDAMWRMAIYRAAEVGVEAGYPYLSWGLPTVRPVSQSGLAGMYHWGNSAEVRIQYYRDLPRFRSDERAAAGQIYKAQVILDENRADPAAAIPLNAVVTGAEYRDRGLL